MNEVVKQGGVAASVVVIGAWVTSYFGGVEVPLEVQGAAAVVLAAVASFIRGVLD